MDRRTLVHRILTEGLHAHHTWAGSNRASLRWVLVFRRTQLCGTMRCLLVAPGKPRWAEEAHDGPR